MMFKKTTKLLTVAIMTIAMLTSSTAEKKTTIFVIGDSTAANKDISNGKMERGWAMVLQSYFDDNIVVDNHALNGRSSLSFLNEGRWDKVIEKMKPGDYVIIQFGHNDEKPKADRHTDPGSTFDYNLARYVRETREHGGIPVLMNCVVRRNFFVNAPENDDDEKLRTQTFKDGVKMVEGDSLIDTHGLYRVAPRDVAKRMNVHFVDANQITHDLEQGLGTEASKKLHMWFLPNTEPSEPKGKQDNTHYSIYGAHTVAKLLADALCEEIPVLKKYRCDADITVDRKGRGNYLSLDEAVKAAQALPMQSVTIQILGGEWTKPLLPKKSKIEFVMRQGATWKNE
jgi:pectinesterase